MATASRATAVTLIEQRPNNNNDNTTNIVTQLAKKSTIYERHEARRRRTLALKDDSRPPAIRVLSQLPGMHILFPAYQPPHKQSRGVGAAVEISPSGTSTSASSLTLLGGATAALDATTSPQDDKTVFYVYSSGENKGANGTNAPSLYSRIMPTVAAAAVGGGLAGAVFGSTATARFANNHHAPSPFAAGKTTIMKRNKVVRVVQNDTLAFLRRQVLVRDPAGSAAAWTGDGRIISSSSSSPAQIASRAISASALFGTKALVEANLGADSGEDDGGLSVLSVASSAIAGGALGFYRTLTAPPRSGVASFVGREVIGATVYFSTYEGIKQILSSAGAEDSSSSSENTGAATGTEIGTCSIPVVAASGAVAGGLYEAIRVGAASHSTTRMMNPYVVPAAVVRAAPAHALLFLGYEMTRRQFAASTSN